MDIIYPAKEIDLIIAVTNHVQIFRAMLLPVEQSYDTIYVHNTATDSNMELHIELQT